MHIGYLDEYLDEYIYYIGILYSLNVKYKGSYNRLQVPYKKYMALLRSQFFLAFAVCVCHLRRSLHLCRSVHIV
jgi:hypothetical protein